MTALDLARSRTVTAPLNFLRPMTERPVAYQFEPPPGIPLQSGTYDAHDMTIEDGRPLAHSLTLDRSGFALFHGPARFTAFDDEAAIRRHYYAEVEEQLRKATDAEFVLNFDHNVRNAARADAGEAGIKAPVIRTHNDFTHRSGRDRAQRELAARGYNPAHWLGGRFAIVNLWRPIARPVLRHPLALCDARSLARGDLVVTDLVYRDRVGEIYAIGHSDGQRWFYFPELRPDEAILIKSYDSDESGVARFSPHSAFDDPTIPDDAPPRESIETRALIFYG
ncbi:hypothetical protein FHR22_003220 [Sphingopyxis panaciterrae]|uniref:CmcJ/NvfI family oxidoreductase n=1 Tax=Sphingopyxis panaciterrae TaxID=363841 RepID=UPI0014228EE4|nr:CmcJ/NvfI family oxidoreductase [Sphingopyxis panaciterrae]NIJ38509.1 hypothetical protein [Sphingopyxis panaciterrae]